MNENINDALSQATTDRDDEVNSLADLEPDQIEYLERVGEIEDETTGLECGGL